jgi:Spy/CpxP family protein refolding chaperone
VPSPDRLTDSSTKEKLTAALLVYFNDLHPGVDDMKRQFALLVCAVGLLAGSLMCFAEDSPAGKSDRKSKSADKSSPAAQAKELAPKKGGSSKGSEEPNVAEKKSASRAQSNLPPVNRRLPAGYGKLELTDEQKEKIFRIREEHSDEVKGLVKQLKDLRAQIDEQYRAVLTDDQKKQLASQKKEKDADEMDDEAPADEQKSAAGDKKTAVEKPSENS